VSDIKIEAHVPFRFLALLTEKERAHLQAAVSRFTPESEKAIAKLEREVRERHRIVKGSFFEGTFEYDGGDDVTRNISAEDFLRSEFPGYCHDSGGVPPSGDEEVPVEFIVTGRYSLLLVKRGPKKVRRWPGVRLLVRRGLVEMDFDIPTEQPSIAEAILTAEKDSRWTEAFLKPISAEIVNCNLLGR
jgi:hypothetical protein